MQKKIILPLFAATLLLLVAATVATAAEPAAPAMPEAVEGAEAPALSTVECDATAEAFLAAGDVTQALPTCGTCSYGTNCDGQSWYASCFTGTAWGSCTPFGSTTCTDGRARCRCYENPP